MAALSPESAGRGAIQKARRGRLLRVWGSATARALLVGAAVGFAAAVAGAQAPTADSRALRSTTPRRGIPAAMRSALLGCWQPWPGERITFTAHGATGLRARARLDLERLRRRFAVRGSNSTRSAATIWYHPARDRVAVPCGPMTQHGQTCLVHVADDGSVVFDLYHYHHRSGARPAARFGETVVATRCE